MSFAPVASIADRAWSPLVAACFFSHHAAQGGAKQKFANHTVTIQDFAMEGIAQMGVQVRVFPCLTDNYGFLVHDEATGETASVDTPEAGPILAQAEAAGWRITQIWNTHHHWDHIGGNDAVAAQTGAALIAPAANKSDITGVGAWVEHASSFTLGETPVRVIATPGHTLGHVAYHLPEDAVVFAGDTLFPLGCGRLFEGSPEQMWTSLCALTALPNHTTVYAAHEYTQANAQFCLAMEPENQSLQARAIAVDDARKAQRPTVPTTIEQELMDNVFLRPHSPAIRQRLGMLNNTDAEVFAALRKRKDTF